MINIQQTRRFPSNIILNIPCARIQMYSCSDDFYSKTDISLVYENGKSVLISGHCTLKVTSINCERGRNYKWEKFTSSLTNSRSVEDWCKREQGTHIKHGRAERPQQPREKVDRSVDPIRRNRRFASPRMRKYLAFYMHWCSYVTILEILSRKEEYRFKQNEYLR